MATLFTPPRYSPIDGNGRAMPSSKLYFFQTGTSTPLDTYSDAGLTTANANPVVADANGLFGPIYLGTSSDYKVIFKTSADVTVWTVDPYFASSAAARTPVADVDYAATISDKTIAYTSISSARAVTLPSAATYSAGNVLTIIDESGLASASLTISVIPSGSDAVNGTTGSKVAIKSAYGSVQLEADGTSKWALVNRRGTSVQVFTSSGTYTPSLGMVACLLECVGGGGGGGGTANTSAGAATGGNGGGGGGYSRKLATATDIGTSKTVTIGAAGAAGTSGPGAGGAGGDTSVGSLCIGKGGSGGGTNSSSAAAAGGVAGTGDLLIPGMPGFIRGVTTTTSTVSAISGAGGSSGGGLGHGGAALGTQSAGNAGQNYGGGGGGGFSYNAGGAAAGGAGAAGVVVITEYF